MATFLEIKQLLVKLFNQSGVDTEVDETSDIIVPSLSYRDGDTKAFERAKYPNELKRRGLELGITEGFIHRIFKGEFDKFDGLEIKVIEQNKVGN